MLRQFVFKTRASGNPLCRFTEGHHDRWILIQLYRTEGGQTSDRAQFLIHAPAADTDRFLRGEFGKRYGTYSLLHQEGKLTSVEVSNYAMPAYRGLDPMQMATHLLGPEVIFEPVLVREGFIHVTVVAVQRSSRPFTEMVDRLSRATGPDEFRLIHQGPWDPLRRLLPAGDALSARQEETLRMAVDLGYYDSPRRCTLEDLAKAFGVSKAAVHKHLQAAEAKVIRAHAP